MDLGLCDAILTLAQTLQSDLLCARRGNSFLADTYGE